MYATPDLQDHHDRYSRAYFSTEVDDPAAQVAADLRRLEYELWASLLPGDDADLAISVLGIQRLTGKGPRQIDNILSAMHRLKELPFVCELQEITHRLDMSRLIAIDLALSKLSDDELIAQIDRKLALYLMPTRANQILPTSGQIRRRICDWIRLYAPKLDVDKKPAAPEPPAFIAVHDENGRSYLNLDAATDVALQIENAVRERAREAGCSEGEALRDLVTGAAKVRIILNVYRAHDVEDAPAYVFGVGWLTPEASDRLADAATQVRDMDEAAEKVSPAYRTPDDIRAYVIGRDGTCRGPGHGRSTEHAQMDHAVDFADGGCTCAANLSSLCPTCHNIKTDGRMFPVIFPGGEIAWLFEDGTWVLVEPEGPLSRKARNWVQTLGQRITQRRAYHRVPEKEDPSPPPSPQW
ncbi:HNH endonuclease signature motif containing protein [Corynebacterium doosanense]|uniref:HNH endonuclease n=1 Tax=Corynebacterium doosanense CAU 212 = DSM 45436 TaxID=558173 RepID=A0A097IEP8_9CORY|nr:HNH endonuclease signature motif containing protein [Corynebacterium doosanense]AIT60606.1 HNH endonuclease [Corynebacterium doosanense CAU 212 = DSM 45436]